jgi:hypothetical protein
VSIGGRIDANRGIDGDVLSDGKGQAEDRPEALVTRGTPFPARITTAAKKAVMQDHRSLTSLFERSLRKHVLRNCQ